MSLISEISRLDFEQLIGAPLISVVNAQAKSAATTVEFIQSVGFDVNNKPEMVLFKYDRNQEVLEYERDGEGNLVLDSVTGQPIAKPLEVKTEEYQLSVPLLTIVPIPFIRVDEANIDFNAKLGNITKVETSASHDFAARFSARAKLGPFRFRISGAYQYKSNRTTDSTTTRSYTMGVQIRAVQDDMPAGMERVLSILEENITDTKVA